jgi:transposase
MLLKTILNRVEKHGSFVFDDGQFVEQGRATVIEVRVSPRANSQPTCPACGKRRPGYDTRSDRRFEYVPVLGFRTFFVYPMRRVDCPQCGVLVEEVPWSTGKSHLTTTFSWFLARWAKRLSWKETAEAFQTSWESVFQAVKMAVEWGRANQNLDGIRSIGVDEVSCQRGHSYLTLVYQIDEGRKRLLWLGRNRETVTIEGFFTWFGEKRSKAIDFICSDMWKPYLNVIAKRAGQAIHVLDRYHIMAKLSKAIDEVRAHEAREMKAKGIDPVLKKSRWCLLKRPENMTPTQGLKLAELLRYNLRTVRSYLLKESLNVLWDFVSPKAADWYLKYWCTKTMHSRIEPMKKVAKTLRAHHKLILNWFRAEGRISAGIVEGLNNKLKLTTRKAYGFRTFDALELALYHGMGDLPEPKTTHRFC